MSDAAESASAHGQNVPRITRPDLAAALSSAQPPALFEVLPTGYWRKAHLPGALSAPPAEAVRIIIAQVPDHDAGIVVYCWDHDCPRARHAAGELVALGYTNVSEYHEGKADWIAAGLPVEKPVRPV